jgi:hypothetical protein
MHAARLRAVPLAGTEEKNITTNHTKPTKGLSSLVESRSSSGTAVHRRFVSVRQTCACRVCFGRVLLFKLVLTQAPPRPRAYVSVAGSVRG